MKKYLLMLLLILLPNISMAQSLSDKLSGRILIDVDKNGEAWYVNPNDLQRYYLGRPADAFDIMRKLGLGISESNFLKVSTSDFNLTRRLGGKIILRVQHSGEAWYVNPVDLKKYFLGRPADAFELMRRLGLGITNENLIQIPKSFDQQIDRFSNYERKTVKTSKGSFEVDMVTIDLSNPKLRIITDTADNFNCKSSCHAKSLPQYINETDAFAGINGTYFSEDPANYNYYFFPVYNSVTGKFINEDQLKWWTTGPLMAFDQQNKMYYFKDSRDFKSMADFEAKFGVKLQAAIGNKPRIIEDYQNVVALSDLDDKQKTAKTNKNALAYKDNKLFLVDVQNATVPDLADVLKSKGMQYAINLDGGGSTSLYYNGKFIAGPSRAVPNAILFSIK